MTVLKPFYDATVEISSNQACISVMIPMTAMLLGKMQTTPDDGGLKQMTAALLLAPFVSGRQDPVRQTGPASVTSRWA